MVVSTQLLANCRRHRQTRRQVSKNDGHDLIHRTFWQLLLATSCWSVVVQQAAANSTSASSTHSRCTRRRTSTTVSGVRTCLRSAVHNSCHCFSISSCQRLIVNNNTPVYGAALWGCLGCCSTKTSSFGAQNLREVEKMCRVNTNQYRQSFSKKYRQYLISSFEGPACHFGQRMQARTNLNTDLRVSPYAFNLSISDDVKQQLR